MRPVLGEIELEGYHLRKKVLSLLAEPIRDWFHDHPEEDALANYYFAHLSRDRDGVYTCHLDVVGRHHWSARGGGKTARTALKNSLDNLLPDLELASGHFDDL